MPAEARRGTLFFSNPELTACQSWYEVKHGALLCMLTGMCTPVKGCCRAPIPSRPSTNGRQSEDLRLGHGQQSSAVRGQRVGAVRVRTKVRVRRRVCASEALRRSSHALESCRVTRRSYSTRHRLWRRRGRHVGPAHRVGHRVVKFCTTCTPCLQQSASHRPQHSSPNCSA